MTCSKKNKKTGKEKFESDIFTFIAFFVLYMAVLKPDNGLGFFGVILIIWGVSLYRDYDKLTNGKKSTKRRSTCKSGNSEMDEIVDDFEPAEPQATWRDRDFV